MERLNRIISVNVEVEDDSQLQSARDLIVKTLRETTYVKVLGSLAGSKQINHEEENDKPTQERSV